MAVAEIFRHSGVAAFVVVEAGFALHKAFEGAVATRCEYMASPPFWFCAQKSGVLFSHEGIRERRFSSAVFNFSLMCCPGASISREVVSVARLFPKGAIGGKFGVLIP